MTRTKRSQESGGQNGLLLLAILGLGAIALAAWKPKSWQAIDTKYIPGPGGVVPPGYTPPEKVSPFVDASGKMLVTVELQSATAEDEALLLWKEKHPTATFVAIRPVGDFEYEIRYLPT